MKNSKTLSMYDMSEKQCPFLSRQGIPNKIGTEDTNCGHMEIGALNCDFEMLNTDDPCVHILDSNAIAFSARAIRDEPLPTMRRRIRGTGVATGKGDLERLWKSMEKLRCSKGRRSKQWEHLDVIQRQMKEWKEPKWPQEYRDQCGNHPIFLVDSHQLNDEGKLSGRYKNQHHA